MIERKGVVGQQGRWTKPGRDKNKGGGRSNAIKKKEVQKHQEAKVDGGASSDAAMWVHADWWSGSRSSESRNGRRKHLTIISLDITGTKVWNDGSGLFHIHTINVCTICCHNSPRIPEQRFVCNGRSN